MWLRLTRGVGAITQLSDQVPWGIWFGFNVLCAAGLAAGAFTIAAAYHILGVKWLRPVVRPAVLTGSLGYFSVVAGLAMEFDRPWDVWRAGIMWNPNALMFAAPWCVLLGAAFVVLDFSTDVLERRGWRRSLRAARGSVVVVAGAAFLLSIVHQAYLGHYFVILRANLHPLWSSPALPMLFVLSALAAAPAIVTFVNEMGRRAFGCCVGIDFLQPLARFMALSLAGFLTLRFWDLVSRNELGGSLVFFGPGSWEASLFWMEAGLLFLPMVLVFHPARRENPQAMFSSSVMVLGGFLTHRLNVSISAVEASSGARYLPSWTEGALALSIVAVAVWLFAIASRYLPVFPRNRIARPRM